MFLYSVWGVACSLCETREARIFFSKKEVKIVLGKERALTVMWTHAQSVIRDPKPQNRGCVLDGHLPLYPCGCVLWEPQQSVILIPSIPSVLLNVLCKEEMCLWAEVTSYFPVLCESDGISWGWHSDFYFFFLCTSLYCSVKPFVQQTYPIQPSVTAPISGNSPFILCFKNTWICTECGVFTSDLGRATTQELMFPPAKGNTNPSALLLSDYMSGKNHCIWGFFF